MGNDKYRYDIFLSHNSLDKPVVRTIAQRLANDGLKVWFDEWVIHTGDDIFLQIEKGLEESRTLILFMSPNAFGSDWVSLERSTSLFRDPTNHLRRFVPFLVADCTIPDVLRRYKYIDFRKREESGYTELLTACRLGQESGEFSASAHKFDELTSCDDNASYVRNEYSDKIKGFSISIPHRLLLVAILTIATLVAIVVFNDDYSVVRLFQTEKFNNENNTNDICKSNNPPMPCLLEE